VTDIQAVILVGPEGVVDRVVEDATLDIETIVGEYITHSAPRVRRFRSRQPGREYRNFRAIDNDRAQHLSRTISNSAVEIQGSDRPGSIRVEAGRLENTGVIPRLTRNYAA